jgi:hypothetical protein
MAAEAITPIDEIGMPLPLAPTNLEIHDASQPKPDWHHHFHPKKSPLLTEDDGGKAVRGARLQKADWGLHHNKYHSYYEGPPLPNTQSQKFGIAVLASAGYVPAEAIDLSSEEPRIVTLSSSQRYRLWRSGELRIGAPDTVRKFLQEYTLGQNLAEVNEKLVDEFLNTPSEQRRYKLGGVLLDFAIEKAVEPLDPFYRTAWKKGYIDRKSAHRPQRLVKTKLRYKTRQPTLVDKLYDTLLAA